MMCSLDFPDFNLFYLFWGCYTCDSQMKEFIHFKVQVAKWYMTMLRCHPYAIAVVGRVPGSPVACRGGDMQQSTNMVVQWLQGDGRSQTIAKLPNKWLYGRYNYS